MVHNRDFGVTLNFYRAQRHERHSHSDIELAYVLEGNIEIGINEDKYRLQKDDLLVVNSGYTHFWNICGEAFVCVIRMDIELFLKEISRDYVTFWCNSVADRDADYKDIRVIISELMTEYSVNMDQLNFRKKSLFYRLMDILLNKYLIESKTRMDMMTEDEMFGNVLKYIRDHYSHQLSLADVASTVFMTSSTFSRYFKKNAGINFLEYLNNQRLQNALEDLLYSEKSLTRIAMDHGFTNPSMFSKAFKSAYGMSPTDYKKARKDLPKEQADKMELPEADYREELKKFVDGKKKEPADTVFKRRVRADAQAFRKYSKVWNEAVNMGTASELLSAKMQQHLLMLRDALGFKYVRIVNIFSWDMKMRRDRNSGQLNFEFIDNVLDFIVTNKMRPIIEFGDKPKRVFQNSNMLLYMEEQEPIFQSLEECRWIFERFVEHIVLRYGVDEVEQWIFDNWFDERAEQRGDYDYLEAFDTIYGLIRSRVPMARVGGCGIELGNNDYSLFQQWSEHAARPSFISVTAFPYKRKLPGFDVQEQGAARSTDLHFLKNELLKLKKKLQEYGFGDIPLMFTEWNLSMSDRNYYNDSCGKAAQMLMNMVELLEDIDLGAYMFGSDLNVRYYDTTKVFFGGTGLLSKDALPKPSYYALYFMKRLGSYIIKSGDGYIVTTDGKGSYYILMFNYKNFNYNYFTKEEEQIKLDELNDIFADSDDIEIEVELANIVEGNYYIKTYNVGIDTSSALNEWRLLGENLELDMSDQEYLKRICIPHITIHQQNVGKGYLLFSETLKASDMRYIHIYK